MKEQAIEYFKFYRKIFCEDYLKSCPKDSIAYQATLKEKEFYDMAIKALEQEHYYRDLAESYEKTINKLTKAIAEQEPILDKISAEIAEYGSIWVEYKITGRRDKDIEQLVSDVLSQAKKQVLEVIDKYKADTEAEDGNDD